MSVNGDAPITTSKIFTIKLAPLSITGFSPSAAHTGDTITITGTGFGISKDSILVLFTGASAIYPIAATPTKLTVIVSGIAQTGIIQVFKQVNPKPVSSKDTFTVLTCTISDFSPKSVYPGDTLKITGTYFGTYTNNVLVYLNKSSSNGIRPFKVNPIEMSLIVPSTAQSGVIRVAVQYEGYADSKNSLTVLKPLPPLTVNDITPSSARKGEVVSINGDFYNADINTITAQFSGSSTLIKPLSINGNDIQVRVPADASNGKIKVFRTGYTPGTTSNELTILPPLPPVQSGTWTQRPDFLTSGKSGACSFTIGTQAYVIGGTTFGPFDGFGNDEVWVYDQTYDAWEQKADFLGGNRVNAVAFTIGNKGYVGTGLDGSRNTTNDFWEYDPATNVWTQKASFKGGKRADAIGFSLNSKGYIGSGYATTANSASTNDFYEYDPVANTWTQKTSLPSARNSAFAFVVGNNAYVGCGKSYVVNKDVYMNDLYSYNPSTNAWTEKAAIPGYNYLVKNSSFTISNKGYIGLGYQVESGSVAVGTNQVFEYNPATNSWNALPNYKGVERSLAVGFSIGNIGYFGLGQVDGSTGVYKDFWAYTP